MTMVETDRAVTGGVDTHLDVHVAAALDPIGGLFIKDANTATRAFKRDELPADLVGTVVFLASPDSDFMTGQTLVVDGGSAMH